MNAPHRHVPAAADDGDPHPVAGAPGPEDEGRGTVIPVVAAVIRRGNRFLLALRRPEKRHGGCWEFPGGKLAGGETEREALSRELREELGVALTGLGSCLFTVMDPGSPFRIRFWEARVEGEPEPLEHAEVRWTTVQEAEELLLAPADATFLRAGPIGAK